MDTFLVIASRREVREYSDRPLPGEAVERILDAGRLSGSSKNRQPWTFLIVGSRDLVDALAQTVYEPANVTGAPLVVAVVLGPKSLQFDAGRVAQNMLLTAWNEGIGGVPNRVSDMDAAREVLGLSADDDVPVVLTFGYPARPRDVDARSATEWSRRANRKALDEVVRRISPSSKSSSRSCSGESSSSGGRT